MSTGWGYTYHQGAGRVFPNWSKDTKAEAYAKLIVHVERDIEITKKELADARKVLRQIKKEMKDAQ